MTEGSFQQPEIASEPMKNLKCAVLMTCHDRPYHTIPAVLNVIAALERSRFIPLVFLIDSSEGSETIDGLASVRRATLRYRRVARDVFWARGMKTAETMAISSRELNENDVILWLNDDVVLDRNAITIAQDCWERVNSADTILVGATREENSSEISYSGKNRLRSSPTSFLNSVPGGSLSPVGTFNGNFVWMSVGRAKFLGGIDGDFVHHGADIEYGIRNELNQGWNLLLGEPIGSCSSVKPNNLVSAGVLFHLFSPLSPLHLGTKKVMLQKIGFTPAGAFVFATLETIASSLRQLLSTIMGVKRE